MVEAQFESVFVAPEDAAAAGLIDAAAYRDVFDALLTTRLGGEPEIVDDYGDEDRPDIEAMLANPFTLLANLEKLLKPPAPPPPKVPHVAVVYATGTIMPGKSQADWSGNVATMGSDTIVAALEAAGDDEHVKAVVLRVNSPGGSALASDMIWRAVQRVREKKPVISSMGSVAASGGYWISMGCDMIMAQPSTITGSIGVVSMVPDLSQAVSELGINVEVVARGPHGDQLAFLKHGVTPVLRETLQRMMRGTYDEFLDKVSEGRGLPRDDVKAMAGGRVWTGRQAAELGLVDELGSLQDAIDMACVLGGGLDPLTTPVFESPLAPNVFEQFEEQMKEQALVRGLFGSGLQAAADELGLGAVAHQVRALLAAVHAGGPRLGAHSVQALLPFSVTLR